MSAGTPSAQLERIRTGLSTCMADDRLRLVEALARLTTDPARGAPRIEQLQARLAQSQARREQRVARLPKPTYPAELPVVGRREEIARAISAHQVTIVCGETGSGKTTQLPKICLEIGRGCDGLIGHTQPRRIAARTVAARIAQELGEPLGHSVGYKIRFQDKTQPQSYVKIMTDGILLAETQGDHLLAAYDTLIIDEAHERSLNIDFLLGYLKQLLPRRPDLKVIVTSATIDADRFSRHFDDAPVIEVSGRLFPVEVCYRPPRRREEDGDDGDELNLTAAVVDACDEASRRGPGHVLVFLPGEREIREVAEALRKHHPPGTEILPLFSRLSAGEQERVFENTSARRIVLSTNVAETSLTVPGIRYVVDTGLARINRYSYRNKVEQLLVEKISQASANQRSGRCGRVMSGVCFRLYDEADFEARPAYTDPELLRSSLAGVILRMKSLDLGDVELFPFLDPPQPRMINDGYQLLAELGAVDDTRRLTPVGRELARLPIDPRIGRMVLEAKRQDCLSEVLVLAAALSIQDPRERPVDRAQTADQRHAQFRDERSDFAGLLKLWQFYDAMIKHKKSNRMLAQSLRDQFLSPLRMREWREVHGQLHAMLAETGARFNSQDAGYERIHRALLSGLLGNIGSKNEEGDYDGARGIRFAIHPSSGLRKRQPRWLVASELVETSRLFSRVSAQVEPTWIEQAAYHLVKRAWLEPHWDKDRAQVVAWEQVSLYGLVLVARRPVAYGPVDPAHARDIFIRIGLVGGAYSTQAPFHHHNERLKRELALMEHKTRRHDVLVDENAMFRFFDARIPADVHAGASFEAWRRQIEQTQPKLLFMTQQDLLRDDADVASVDRFPDSIVIDETRFKLRYRFDPGHPLDGVTTVVPLHLLNRLRAAQFEWLVPGLLRDKLNVLVRSLPKHQRRLCVPLPDTVTACLDVLGETPREQRLGEALASTLKQTRGLELSPATWDEAEIPVHLRMNFCVVDEQGHEVAQGRDLTALQDLHGSEAQAQFAPETKWERPAIRSWDDLELPETVQFRRGREHLNGHPALVDEGDSVRLTLFETADKAEEAGRHGIVRLVRLTLRDQVRALERTVSPSKNLVLAYMPLGSSEQLQESLVRASLDRAVWADAGPVRDRRAFDVCLQHARARLQIVGQEYLRLTEEIMGLVQQLRKALDGPNVKAFKHAAQDMTRQLQALVYPNFVAEVPYGRLQHYPRYLTAMQRRLEKLPTWPDRDEQHTRELSRWWQLLVQRTDKHRKAGTRDSGLEEFRWMLEEQRVSLFAQELKTPYPISYKRLDKVWGALR